MRRIFASARPLHPVLLSLIALLCGAAALCAAAPARARVAIAIDLTHQTMHVSADAGTYDWPISSARRGFSTPGGSYAPTHLARMHYSKKYHRSPMPYSIFFRGGYAIHGTYARSELGRPASHGCVRLAPENAALLFAMVRSEGGRISIFGTPPASRPFAHEYAGRFRHGHRTHVQSADARMPPSPREAPRAAFDLFGLGGAGL